ncbi:MAG: dihydrolipoyl dehydrogenase [Planctomycetota bacterium]
MADSFDLIVIGGGPAGYVAAIRAAQLGMKTAIVERDKLGGTCLNWGCIPTKALLKNAELYHTLTHSADQFGLSFDNLSFDWSKTVGRSRNTANTLNKGVIGLMKKNKVKSYEGHAHIPAAGKVTVYDKADTARKGKPTAELAAGKVLICTGAHARPLPGTPFDHDKVINARDAMTLAEQPKKLLIVGSGAIGMEFAYFFNAYGTEVTVVEMVDRVLPIEDNDSSKAVQKSFEKAGVKFKLKHLTTDVKVNKSGVSATIAPVGKDGKPDAGKAETIEADKVLVAIGVMGRYDGLFDESLGIETFKDHIKVDFRKQNADYQTSVPGIYAVGDVIGPPWLAHVASEEAILCVERMAGHHAPDIQYDAIPGCTYCHPQIASIGMPERAAKEAGIDYVAATFPFMASGKAQALGDTTGFTKIIASKAHGEILGVHMVGDSVTEMIAEASLAMRNELTADELIATIHPHPTLSETTHEAALGTEGRMIHL